MVKMLLPYYKKVTKMGSIIGQRINSNGVGVPRGQQHMSRRN